jgi:hypothetical protein
MGQELPLEMTSSPSHEIFNRIEALTNLIYLIKVDARQPEKIAFYAEIAASEIERLAALALLLGASPGPPN